METNVLKSIPIGTTIPLVPSWFKYWTIPDKISHFDQFQEFQLENMFQSKMTLVESPPLLSHQTQIEREKRGKKLREGLPCHYYVVAKEEEDF